MTNPSLHSDEPVTVVPEAEPAVNQQVTSTVTNPALRSDEPVTAQCLGKERKWKGSGKEGSTSLRDVSASRPTVAEVQDIWNAIVTAPIPKVQKLTRERQRKISARLQTYPDLAVWRTVIAWVNQQDWCRANSRGTHAKWTASIDWLTKSDTAFQRCVERAIVPPDAAAERAASFLATYGAAYHHHRGAAYTPTEGVEANDRDSAVRLCAAYTDSQLAALVAFFLAIPPDREPFLAKKTRTVSMLLSMAPAIAERLWPRRTEAAP